MKDYTVVIGTNNIDEYYEMDAVPVMGDKVICKPLSVEVGGMLANAAAIHAGYGAKTYMIDFMSPDANGRKVAESLNAARVDTSYITYDERIPVSKCLIMLRNGERIIFVLPGCKNALALSREQTGLIKNAGFVYSSLAELRVLLDERDFLRLFTAGGPSLAIDVEQGTLKEPAYDWDILQKSRLLFVNDGGNDKLASLYGPDYIQRLNQGATIVVRTMGHRGCAVYAPEEDLIRIPGLSVATVDTTGAGDTFNASFLYGYTQGWTLQRCAEFANTAAARATTFFGPRGGIADELTVWNFLNTEKEK